MKINIGSGNKRIDGFLNVDINKRYNPDFVMDVTNGLKFKNNSIDEIKCFHLLEHIEPNKLDFVISEFHRVLKYEGKLHIKVPHFTHTPYEFHYYHARLAYLKNYYEKYGSPFFLLHRKINFKNKVFDYIFNIFPYAYENSFLRSIFFAFEVELILSKDEKIFNKCTGGK